MATTRAPRLTPFSSPSAGRRTFSTTSASRSASSRLPAMAAPAASYSPSGKPERAPAPACTTTSAPRPLYFLTTSGVAATRVSTPSVSVRTAIRIRPPWFAAAISARPAPLQSVEDQHEQEQSQHRGGRAPRDGRGEQTDGGGD